MHFGNSMHRNKEKEGEKKIMSMIKNVFVHPAYKNWEKKKVWKEKKILYARAANLIGNVRKDRIVNKYYGMWFCSDFIFFYISTHIHDDMTFCQNKSS